MGLKHFSHYCSNCGGKTKHYLCDAYDEEEHVYEVYKCEFCLAKFILMERKK